MDDAKPAQPVESTELPDIRVVSVIYDNDHDHLKVSYDDELLGPFESLGMLVAGTMRQLLFSCDLDTDLDVDSDDETDL